MLFRDMYINMNIYILEIYVYLKSTDSQTSTETTCVFLFKRIKILP